MSTDRIIQQEIAVVEAPAILQHGCGPASEVSTGDEGRIGLVVDAPR